MKKINYLLACLIATTVSWASVPVKISGSVFNTKSKEITFSQLIGETVHAITSSKLNKDGTFEIATTIPQSDYFMLQVEEGIIHLIIRENADIKVYADAKDLGAFTNIVGSDESVAFHGFLYLSDVWNQRKNEAIQRMQTNPEIADQVNAEMQPIFQEFQGHFQTFVNENQNSPALLATLNVINPDNEFSTFESIVNSLNASFGQSKKVQEMVGVYTQLRDQKNAGNMFAPGKVAPDFEELMVDRKTKMKLSDLRGNVVLLDFWASWCGPCRRENPNVVAVYHKYKDKGFTVMNVSLDDNLDNWKNAIKHDGLEWPNHVSDLKKWNSAVGKMYQVTGIPFTVLIDQEGKIVSTNLRGQQLEDEVARLLQ